MRNKVHEIHTFIITCLAVSNIEVLICALPITHSKLKSTKHIKILVLNRRIHTFHDCTATSETSTADINSYVYAVVSNETTAKIGILEACAANRFLVLVNIFIQP